MRPWVGFLKKLVGKETRPDHLERGECGERAAQKHLQSLGFRLVVANYRIGRLEIDLVMRDAETLVFVEVKTRGPDGWTRPAAAVNSRKKRLLSQAALRYLAKSGHPKLPIRFDIVEVLMDESRRIVELRHLPAAFALSSPYRYG